MLIGQERKWQEEPDLLALDKEGALYIFELKRWESISENILQIMRYGQIFGRYTYEELGTLARMQQKLEGSLKEKHQEYFSLEEPIKESRFNQQQRFVLVTNGVDTDTISAIEYWSNMGVNIDCSPYRIYDIGGKPYIQFDTYNPIGEVIPEINTWYFIVNTNKTWMDSAWQDMIGDRKKGKAAAYYNRKWAICKIPVNSIIYLYHTGVGVIAKGKAVSSVKKKDFDGDIDEEFYIELDFEWAQPKENWNEEAIPAWEINSKLNTGHRFRQTAFTISDDMAQAIDEIARKKRAVRQERS